jgi:hypothetical protein
MAAVLTTAASLQTTLAVSVRDSKAQFTQRRRGEDVARPSGRDMAPT